MTEFLNVAISNLHMATTMPIDMAIPFLYLRHVHFGEKRIQFMLVTRIIRELHDPWVCTISQYVSPSVPTIRYICGYQAAFLTLQWQIDLLRIAT